MWSTAIRLSAAKKKIHVYSKIGHKNPSSQLSYTSKTMLSTSKIVSISHCWHLSNDPYNLLQFVSHISHDIWRNLQFTVDFERQFYLRPKFFKIDFFNITGLPLNSDILPCKPIKTTTTLTNYHAMHNNWPLQHYSEYYNLDFHTSHAKCVIFIRECRILILNNQISIFIILEFLPIDCRK